MAQTRIMYGIEHAYSDGRQTYEIFSTSKEAEVFLQNDNIWNENHIPLFIFKADFNTDLLYKEDNKHWNYDDFSNAIVGNYEEIKILNQYPDYFER